MLALSSNRVNGEGIPLQHGMKLSLGTSLCVLNAQLGPRAHLLEVRLSALKNRKSGPRTLDSWAQGPDCLGPNCPGPHNLGSNLPRVNSINRIDQ